MVVDWLGEPALLLLAYKHCQMGSSSCFLFLLQKKLSLLFAVLVQLSTFSPQPHFLFHLQQDVC